MTDIISERQFGKLDRVVRCNHDGKRINTFSELFDENNSTLNSFRDSVLLPSGVYISPIGCFYCSKGEYLGGRRGIN